MNELSFEGARTETVAGADPGICFRGSRTICSQFLCIFPSPPYSLPSLRFIPLPPLPFPLEVGSPLNQLGSEERCKVPSGVRGRTPAKTNLVHSKAVRKPLVAVILSVCFTEKNDQNLALANMVSLQIANRQYVHYTTYIVDRLLYM